MTIKEMDFVRDRLSAAIIDLETAFEDASPFMPMTESVRRAIKMMERAKETVDTAHAKAWDQIIGSQNDDA